MNSNRLFKILLINMVCVLITACTPNSPVIKRNALLIYMAADNNLNHNAIKNINELERSLWEDKNRTTSVYVYLDRKGENDNPVVYKLTPDTLPSLNSEIEFIYPEQNSSDPHIFSKIFTDIQTICSQRNENLEGMLFWSHGSAWLPEDNRIYKPRENDFKTRTISRDESAINSDAKEMKITEFTKTLQGIHLKYLIFDACFMNSIEVAYQLRANFDYIIASPAEILATGLDYTTLLKSVELDETGFSRICDDYIAKYSEKKGEMNTATMAVVKTENLDEFARRLSKVISKNALGKAFTNAIQYDTNKSNLLFDISGLVNNIDNTEERIQLSNLLKKIIIHYSHTNTLFDRISLADSIGLSLFIPNSEIEINSPEYEHYKEYDWARDSGIVTAYRADK